MFCPQCGKPVLDGARFCNSCGSSLTPSAAAAGAGQGPASAVSSAGGSRPGLASASPPPGASSAGMIARIKNIIVSPKSEWPVIAGDPSSASALYLGHVAPLVAIGVVATFVGQSTVGLPFVGRGGVGAALAHAIISYVLSFLGVFLIALIVDLLAPSFGGQRNGLAALKVTVYSFTPGWIAAIFNVIPSLSVLGIIGSLYGLYLLYLGLPVLMRSPPDKSIGYTVVTVICAIVMWVVLAALTTCAVGGLGFVGSGAMGRMGAHADSASTADAAAVVSSIFGGKTDADKARINEALQTLKNLGVPAAEGGSPGAARDVKPIDVNAAVGAVGQIVAGGKDVQPIDFHRLKEMLPAGLPGMQRLEASAQSGEAMGLKGSSATARYSDGKNASISIEIADMASLSGLAALATRFDPNVEKETDTGYERMRRVDGQLVHERYDRQNRSGELSIILANRFTVTVHGQGVSAEALADALQRIDLTQLASAGVASRVELDAALTAVPPQRDSNAAISANPAPDSRAATYFG